MKKTILIFLLITNCSIFEDPIQAYYNFENNDFNKLLSLELNNVIKYENVIVIKSNSDTPRIISSSTDRNVNIVYYDIIKGIVGFDDLDNKQWRIIN